MMFVYFHRSLSFVNFPKKINKQRLLIPTLNTTSQRCKGEITEIQKLMENQTNNWQLIGYFGPNNRIEPVIFKKIIGKTDYFW